MYSNSYKKRLVLFLQVIQGGGGEERKCCNSFTLECEPQEKSCSCARKLDTTCSELCASKLVKTISTAIREN
jgi:hypothetical protein